jgi:hypothetical protein
MIRIIRFEQSRWVLMGLAAASCVPQEVPTAAKAEASKESCISTTIDALWRNPPEFENRRVCVSGFLGRLVPYGEATPEIFSTKEDAEPAFSDRRVVLGLPFTLEVQERLSRYSVQPLRVEGVFQLESPCVPAKNKFSQDTVCESAPEMRISGARLTFMSGAKFP